MELKYTASLYTASFPPRLVCGTFLLKSGLFFDENPDFEFWLLPPGGTAEQKTFPLGRGRKEKGLESECPPGIFARSRFLRRNFS